MKNNIYFVSDTHWDDERFDIMQRPFFKNIDEQIDHIKTKWNQTIPQNSIVYYLGDMFVHDFDGDLLNSLNGHKILVKGNYDTLTDEEYSPYFTKIEDSVLLKVITRDEELILYLNHYPEKGKKEYFNIVGHIHSTWKIQRNMINVGVDAWHFYPVSLKEILFNINAIKKYYDINVFAGELEVNKK